VYARPGGGAWARACAPFIVFFLGHVWLDAVGIYLVLIASIMAIATLPIAAAMADASVVLITSAKILRHSVEFLKKVYPFLGLMRIHLIVAMMMARIMSLIIILPVPNSAILTMTLPRIGSMRNLLFLALFFCASAFASDDASQLGAPAVSLLGGLKGTIVDLLASLLPIFVLFFLFRVLKFALSSKLYADAHMRAKGYERYEPDRVKYNGMHYRKKRDSFSGGGSAGYPSRPTHSESLEEYHARQDAAPGSMKSAGWDDYYSKDDDYGGNLYRDEYESSQDWRD